MDLSAFKKAPQMFSSIQSKTQGSVRDCAVPQWLKSTFQHQTQLHCYKHCPVPTFTGLQFKYYWVNSARSGLPDPVACPTNMKIINDMIRVSLTSKIVRRGVDVYFACFVFYFEQLLSLYLHKFYFLAFKKTWPITYEGVGLDLKRRQVTCKYWVRNISHLW